MPNTLSAGSPIEQYLTTLHQRYAGVDEGKVADYIPELAKADPKAFAICIATRDGHVYEIGDTRIPFTIQSISKALAYGLALEDRGEDFILQRISVEPSGDAFNAISLKPGSGAPFNPMINAGAIATCGLIRPTDQGRRIDRILAYLSTCAGRRLDIDQTVYASESATGHRNRAIGWMLRNFGIIDEEPTDILETYFQQCAITVTCRDLALMGATLSNNGRNPLTHEQAIAPEYVDNILAVMSSCGMYDFSGEWLYRIGLPAKSGVGGGIMAVLPGQLGIGVFSPPLDVQGNSVRGIRVCADLSRDLALHLFAGGSAPQPALRLSYDGSQVSSSRRRHWKQQSTLRASGYRIRVLDLQGILIFSTFEPIVRLALKQAPYCQYLILNFRNVVSIDVVAARLIGELQARLAQQDVELLVCNVAAAQRKLLASVLPDDCEFVDTDTALEHCENTLLANLLSADCGIVAIENLANHPLLDGLNPADLDWLDGKMATVLAKVGEHLISAGDAADCFYLVNRGEVEVRLPGENGQSGRRLDNCGEGMVFGEMGFLDKVTRSANVIALENVTCRVIDRALFEQIRDEQPRIMIHVLEQLSRQISANLRRANIEAMTFKS